VLKNLRNSEAFGEKNLLQKGFTLVELLVVIVILGILAAVVVFAVGGSTEEAKNSACEADLASAQTAVEAYKAQNDGADPTAWNQLTHLKKAPAGYELTDGEVTVIADGVCDDS
jgi:type II secretion system protein G